MWPDRRVIDLFGIEHPLILAPMAGVGTVGLAASVCMAGGLGSVSCATLQPERAAQTIKQLREVTDRPINANFFCHARAKSDTRREQAWRERLSRYYRELGIDTELQWPHFDIAPFGTEMCAVVEAVRPEVVSFHFGLPEPALLARVRAAGCRVMSSATTVEEARWLESHGADVIIAQGNEAGGHRGMFLSPDRNAVIASQPGVFALVPQVVDAVRVPVVAAGGIADARGIAAAFALGASGVQIGTGYLLCPEAATSKFHRDAIRHAHVDSTVLSNLFTGRPARVLASRLTREIGPMSDAAPDFPLPLGALLPLISQAEPRGINDFAPLWSGEAAALASDLPGERLTLELAKGAIERFRQLGSGVDAVPADFTPPAKNSASPFADLRGHHVAVRTTSLGEAKDFYVGKLDFRVVAEWDYADEKLAYLAPPTDDHFYIEVLGGGDNLPTEVRPYADLADSLKYRGYHHFCLSVTSVENTVAKLRSRGVRIVTEPFILPAISRKLAFLADPFGNLIELAEVLP